MTSALAYLLASGQLDTPEIDMDEATANDGRGEGKKDETGRGHYRTACGVDGAAGGD